MIAVGQILRAQRFILYISNVAEVVARELLHREATYHIPATVLIAQMTHQSVDILLQSLLAHEVSLGVGAQSELLASLLVIAELLVVAIAMSIMERGRSREMLIQVHRQRENIMVLPEVICGLGPVAAIGHFPALGHIVAIGILFKQTTRTIGQRLIECVIPSQTGIIEVLIGLDACGQIVAPRTIVQTTVHDTVVVIASGDTIPGLTRLLKVADVLVANHEVVTQPSQSAIVRATASAGTMYISVCVGFVIGAVKDKVVPQQTRRETATHIIGIVRAP